MATQHRASPARKEVGGPLTVIDGLEGLEHKSKTAMGFTGTGVDNPGKETKSEEAVAPGGSGVVERPTTAPSKDHPAPSAVSNETVAAPEEATPAFAPFMQLFRPSQPVSNQPDSRQSDMTDMKEHAKGIGVVSRVFSWLNEVKTDQTEQEIEMQFIVPNSSQGQALDSTSTPNDSFQESACLQRGSVDLEPQHHHRHLQPGDTLHNTKKERETQTTTDDTSSEEKFTEGGDQDIDTMMRAAEEETDTLRYHLAEQYKMFQDAVNDNGEQVSTKLKTTFEETLAAFKTFESAIKDTTWTKEIAADYGRLFRKYQRRKKAFRKESRPKQILRDQLLPARLNVNPEVYGRAKYAQLAMETVVACSQGRKKTLREAAEEHEAIVMGQVGRGDPVEAHRLATAAIILAYDRIIPSPLTEDMRTEEKQEALKGADPFVKALMTAGEDKGWNGMAGTDAIWMETRRAICTIAPHVKNYMLASPHHNLFFGLHAVAQFVTHMRIYASVPDRRKDLGLVLIKEHERIPFAPTHTPWPVDDETMGIMAGHTIVGPYHYEKFGLFRDEVWTVEDYDWLGAMGYTCTGGTRDFGIWVQVERAIPVIMDQRHVYVNVNMTTLAGSLRPDDLRCIDREIVEEIGQSKPGTHITRETWVRNFDKKRSVYGPNTKHIIHDSVLFGLNRATSAILNDVVAFGTQGPAVLALVNQKNNGEAMVEIMSGLVSKATDYCSDPKDPRNPQAYSSTDSSSDSDRPPRHDRPPPPPPPQPSNQNGEQHRQWTKAQRHEKRMEVDALYRQKEEEKLAKQQAQKRVNKGKQANLRPPVYLGVVNTRGAWGQPESLVPIHNDLTPHLRNLPLPDDEEPAPAPEVQEDRPVEQADQQHRERDGNDDAIRELFEPIGPEDRERVLALAATQEKREEDEGEANAASDQPENDCEEDDELTEIPRPALSTTKHKHSKDFRSSMGPHINSDEQPGLSLRERCEADVLVGLARIVEQPGCHGQFGCGTDACVPTCVLHMPTRHRINIGCLTPTDECVGLVTFDGSAFTTHGLVRQSGIKDHQNWVMDGGRLEVWHVGRANWGADDTKATFVGPKKTWDGRWALAVRQVGKGGGQCHSIGVALEEVAIQAVTSAAPVVGELRLAMKSFEFYAEMRHLGFLLGPKEVGFDIDNWAKRQIRDSMAGSSGYIWYTQNHLLDGNSDEPGPQGEYAYPVPVIQTKTVLIQGTDGQEKFDLGPETYCRQAVRSRKEVRFIRNEKQDIGFGHTGELVCQMFIRRGYFPSPATAPAAQLTRYGKVLTATSEPTLWWYGMQWQWPTGVQWVQPDSVYDLKELVKNMPGPSRKKYWMYHTKGDTGRLGYYDTDEVDKCFAKTDEALVERKARIITNAHQAKFVYLQTLVQQTCAVLIEAGQLELFPGVFFSYGAKMVEKDRDRWWAEVNAASEGTYILVAGDDNLICDYRNGVQTWIEGDVSACDQSHGIEALDLLRATLKRLEWPSEYIEEFVAGYYSPVTGYFNVQFITPQLHTGYPYTSFANTLLIGGMCSIAAFRSKTDPKPLLAHLHEVIANFRMTWKVQEVTRTNASFLKGLWVDGKWSPLPSRIWKATMWRTQGNVKMSSVAAHVRGVARSVQFSALDPLMRAWCKAVLGPHHMEGTSRNTDWWANVEVSSRATWEERGGDASRQAWSELVQERYGVTQTEYDDEIMFFENTYDVREFYVRTTRTLVNLVERDYASEGQDAFDGGPGVT